MSQREMKFVPTTEQIELFKSTARQDEIGAAARKAFAQMLAAPLRKTTDKISTVREIFTSIPLGPGADNLFPLDTDDINAYTMPKDGGVPQNLIEGDAVRVPTFTIGADVQWRLSFANQARFDVPARAIHKLRQAITRKEELNGWATILAAAANSTNSATILGSGFVKEVLSNMMVQIKRANGDSGGTLTDLYLSPEAMADIRAWTEAEVDELTRKEILRDAGLRSLYNVRLHEMTEFGNGQQYNIIYADFDAAVADGSQEVVIGLDLSMEDSFVMPVRQELATFDNPMAITQFKQGVLAYEEIGFGVLDERRVAVGVFQV